jgi:uncharacterized delta-60 repeat protein
MQSKFTRSLGLTALLACYFSFNVNAQDGSIDPSFGTSGMVLDPPGNYSLNRGGGHTPRLLVYPDGKILHIASSATGTKHTRYLPDGALDITFGTGGTIDVPAGTGLGNLRDALLMQDGRYVIVGHTTFNGVSTFGVMRFHANGSPDNSFDGDGKVAVPIPSGGAVGSVALQPDGKLVITGGSRVSGEDMFTTVRLLSNGALDTSFDGDGMVYTNFNDGYEGGRAVAIQTDGKIVVAGEVMNLHTGFGVPNTNQDIGVVRYLPDGTLDVSFDGDGKATMWSINLTDFVTDVMIQPDGRIVVGGYQYVTGDPDSTYLFAQSYLPNGGPDVAFGGGGQSRTQMNGEATGTDAALQADGKVLVAGYRVCFSTFCINPGNGGVSVVRFLQNGQLDPTFGGSGKIEYAYQPGSSSQPQSIEYGNGLAFQGNKLLLGSVATFNYNSNPPEALLIRLNNSSPLLSDYPVVYYQDTDGDGYGNSSVTSTAYSQPAGYTIKEGDCNDGSAAINPGAPEVLNGLDDNCNGQIDEGLNTPTYITIPARIEAEHYTAMSGVQKEPTQDQGGGENVGYIDMNDWIEYRIAVPAGGGNYDFITRVASGIGARFELRMNDGMLLATVEVPRTEGWQNWTTVSTPVTLPQGNHTIRLVSTSYAGWNINWLEFAVPGNYVTIPAKIEAEAYTNQFGTQNEPTSDAGGGQNVGYIDENDFLEYKVRVTAAGAFTLTTRVASIMSGGQFVVTNHAGDVLARVNVPNTGGWQNWTDVSTTLNLPAGDQVLRLVSSSAPNWNINYLVFSQDQSSYVRIPAKIEAEAYTAMSGVQNEPTSDAGGGQNVGYIDIYDWMDYNINVPSAGQYKLDLRVATPSISNPEFQVKIGDQVLATVKVPNTGGFQNWTTVSVMVNLPAGNQTVRLISTGGGYWNINWLQFSWPASPAITKAIPVRITGESSITTGSVTIAPNPVRDVFNLELDNKHGGAVRVEVVSITGRMEKGFTLNKTTGKSRHALSLAGLAKGEYILRITSGGVTQTSKLIKL